MNERASIGNDLSVTAERTAFGVPFVSVQECAKSASSQSSPGSTRAGGHAFEAHQREAVLVARLRTRESAALADAYDQHHTHLRAFAMRLVGDEMVAEDLVQDAFVALPHAIARFRGQASLRTFLLSIAVNHARHHVRSAVRRRNAHAKLELEPPTSAQGPEDHARRRETAAALIRALDALPIEQRIAIVLCDVEDFSSAEAAQIVGVPEGTIRTRVFHAKRKLREALKWLR